MKKSNMREKLTASLLSMAMAASAIPAYTFTANAVSVPTVSLTTEKKADLQTMDVGDVYSANIAQYASSGISSITFTVTADYDTSFSYGFGISVEKSASAPKYWIEHNSKGEWEADPKNGGYSVSLKKGVPTDITIDVSELALTYEKESHYEFRNYYSAHWDNSAKDMVDNTVTLQSVKINDSDTPITTTTADPSAGGTETTTTVSQDDERINIVPNNNKHTNGDNWSFKDNGDGTATISSTVARQIDGLDIVLTKGYDEDYYAANPSTDPDKPINSHKFKFSDFGLTDMDGVIIESLTSVIESDTPMDQFVYGGGLNVQKESPADTEYAKQIAGIEGKEKASYWYNDMGLEGDGSVAYFEEQGVEFQITPGNGGKIFDAGDYIEAYWEVPAEVQPYTSTTTSDAISFQYWWGNDTEGEEVESVKLTSAILTYTKTVTVPYTSSIAKTVGESLKHEGKEADKNLELVYADFDLDETQDVYAIRFDISAKSDIGKMVYNIGTGVDERVNKDYWFQEEQNFCVLEAGDKVEVMWIVPTKAAGDEAHENGVNTKDGKFQIGYYYGEADAVTVDNIEIYYNVPETTTTTTTATTTVTTTTTAATTTTTEETTTEATTTTELTATLWGDANVDGKVSISDAVAILQSIANSEKYALKPQGKVNADVYDNGSGITGMDASVIQLVDAKVVAQSALPLTQEEFDSYSK